MNKLIGIQLVTFDMDGTLIDDEWAHEQAKSEIARSIGADGELDLPLYTGKSNRIFWQHILDKFGLDGSIEELMGRQYHRVLELCRCSKQVEPLGLTDAVKYLKFKGIKTAITSGSDDYFVDQVLEFLKLTPYFDFNVPKNQVKEAKPAPDIYLKAQEIAGISAEHSVGVEDSNSGCCALHAAGMKCIGFTNKGANMQPLEDADLKISTMLELIELIG